jgi:hypothetical protein
MESNVNPGYTKASNLVFLSMGIAAVYNLMTAPGSFGIVVLIVLLYGILGFLMRTAYKHIRTIALVLLILELVSVPFIFILNIRDDNGFGLLVSLVCVAIRVWACLIIWKMPAIAGAANEQQSGPEDNKKETLES